MFRRTEINGSKKISHRAATENSQLSLPDKSDAITEEPLKGGVFGNSTPSFLIARCEKNYLNLPIN